MVSIPLEKVPLQCIEKEKLAEQLSGVELLFIGDWHHDSIAIDIEVAKFIKSLEIGHLPLEYPIDSPITGQYYHEYMMTYDLPTKGVQFHHFDIRDRDNRAGWKYHEKLDSDLRIFEDAPCPDMDGRKSFVNIIKSQKKDALVLLETRTGTVTHDEMAVNLLEIMREINRHPNNKLAVKVGSAHLHAPNPVDKILTQKLAELGVEINTRILNLVPIRNISSPICAETPDEKSVEVRKNLTFFIPDIQYGRDIFDFNLKSLPMDKVIPTTAVEGIQDLQTNAA